MPLHASRGRVLRGASVRTASSSQTCATAVLLDLDLAALVEIVDDVLPFEIAVASYRKAVVQLLPQQHGVVAAEHLTAYACVGLVVDRPRVERCLRGLECVLHAQQLR